MSYDLAARVKELLPDDDFSVSQYLLGLDYFKRRIQAVFPPGGTFLDVGCGAGNWAIAAASYHNRVIGIDLRRDRLDAAEKMSAEYVKGGNVQFVHASVQQIPLADGEVDCCLCYNMMPLLDFSHRSFLQELRRVTKPHGRLYLWGTDLGYLAYLLVQALENRSLQKMVNWTRIALKNGSFLLGIRDQPSVWIGEKYIMGLSGRTGWEMIWAGDEAAFGATNLLPIYPAKYLRMSFGKEYLLKAI